MVILKSSGFNGTAMSLKSSLVKIQTFCSIYAAQTEGSKLSVPACFLDGSKAMNNKRNIP